MDTQDRWNRLSLSEKSDLMRVFIENGITSLKDMRNQYNSIVPAEVEADYPNRDAVYKRADESNAPFIRRAKDVNRNTIPDWENPDNVATHKMSWAEADGKYYAYPNIQEMDGNLHDYTDPKYKHDKWDALSNALKTGNAIPFDSPADARYFTEHYKEHYNGFNQYKSGGKIHIKEENEGKFTASAQRAGMGVQEFARHVLANKDDYSTTQIKRANFARNFGGNRKDDGGPLDEGGYPLNTREQREKFQMKWDPAGGLNPFTQWLFYPNGNQSEGEENEYYRGYNGLPNALPRMKQEAKTEWDDIIEQRKIEAGYPESDFYGTTPRMDLEFQGIADTLNTGYIYRNYDTLKDKYPNLPSKKAVKHIYETGKKVMDNPGKWTQVEEKLPLSIYQGLDYTNESSPLGMLGDFGMKWVPEENAIYVHDTYDFPEIAIKTGQIADRPKEMKIRGKVNYDPQKGSLLLRDNMKNFNSAFFPAAIRTKK